jgi:hypothetical protein
LRVQLGAFSQNIFFNSKIVFMKKKIILTVALLISVTVCLTSFRYKEDKSSQNSRPVNLKTECGGSLIISNQADPGVARKNGELTTNISVSIDAQGNITCPDITVTAGSDVTWSVTGGTITGITPGTPSPFSGSPQLRNGQWSATVGSISGDYSLSGRTSGGQPTQRHARPPRITVSA